MCSSNYHKSNTFIETNHIIKCSDFSICEQCRESLRQFARTKKARSNTNAAGDLIFAAIKKYININSFCKLITELVSLYEIKEEE